MAWAGTIWRRKLAFGLLISLSAVGSPAKVPLPWPVIDGSLAGPKTLKYETLRHWLLQHRNQLGVMPPVFSNSTEATQVLLEWKHLAADLEIKLAERPRDIDASLLMSTFYLYGHSLQQSGAGERALQVAFEAEQANPNTPLPYLLEGLVKLQLQQSDSLRLLNAALAVGKDPRVAAIVHLAIATRYIGNCRYHLAALELDEARKACPVCLAPYSDWLTSFRGIMESTSGPRQTIPNERLKDFQWAGGKLSSGFWGFAIRLPRNWSLGQSPKLGSDGNSVSVTLSAAEDHSQLTVMARVGKIGGAHSIPLLSSLFDKAKNYSEIRPLSKNKWIEKWYTFETNKDSQLGYVALSKWISPTEWSLPEHKEKVSSDSGCEALPGDPIPRSTEAPVMRINQPVELAWVYRVWKKQTEQAKIDFSQFMDGLAVESRTGSVVFSDPTISRFTSFRPDDKGLKGKHR